MSFEPSVYVTTRFPLASFSIEAILEFWSATSASFEIFASSLDLLYSSFNFALIVSNSSSVTLAGSATVTFSVGALISYLSVWDLTTNWTYPGLCWRTALSVEASKVWSDGIELASSLSLATMKLVHWFGALRVVTPVILIVAVLLSADTVPSPFVTTSLSILPVVNP